MVGDRKKAVLVTVIKCHDQGSLEKKSFIWAHGSRGLRSTGVGGGDGGWSEGMLQEQEAEGSHITPSMKQT